MSRRRQSDTIAVEEGLRKRQNEQVKDASRSDTKPLLARDWDPDLPYGGRVYLARQKKPDSWTVIALEVTALVLASGLGLYAYFYFDNFHYHVTRGYAHLGYPEAQHVLGDKFYHGHGVDQDQHKAMEWYKLAADQGHPHASFNLAVGHLRGIRKDLLQKGEPHHLLRKAASGGVKEAVDVLNNLCTTGQCDD